MSRNKRAPESEPAATPVAATYRFRFRAPWLPPFLTVTGIAGDEAAARAYLHRLLDQSLVGIERAGHGDPKTLKTVTATAAEFTDGATLSLPEGCAVEPGEVGWTVTLAGKTLAWRPGFSWHRVRAEVEQLRCAGERAQRGEKPRLFAAGV